MARPSLRCRHPPLIFDETVRISWLEHAHAFLGIGWSNGLMVPERP
jgi:hypothetical protein